MPVPAIRSLLFLLLAALMAPAPGLAAGDGHALVIGNAAYRGVTPLLNTLNDARDMAAKLEAIGFDVSTVENTDRRALTRAVNEFLRSIRGSDAPALVYYSGHGMQVGGQNYLIPIDAHIEDELDVPTEGVGLNRVLAGMGGRGDEAVNLVVLDACRNNPFKSGDRAIGDRGLARVAAPGGTLILYATKPGEVASDNPRGRNGLFTKHLLDAIDEPGVKVQDTFQQVAINVYRESGRRQSPWQEGVLYRHYYFVPPPIPPAPPGALGYLQVSVDVSTAMVAVNGRPVGEAGRGRPLNLNAGLPAGPVRVTVEAGGQRRERVESIRPNQWTQASFSLVPPVPSPEPPVPPEPTPPDPAQQLEAQLKTCRAHFDANRLTTGEGGNALACYRAVLDQEQGNRIALAGIEAIANRYGDWAESNLERGRLDRAETYLERMAEASPENPRLAGLQKQRQAARDAARVVAGAADFASVRPVVTAAAPVAAVPIEPEMVSIPGGSFRMGSNDGYRDEKPVHRVTVQPFLIGKYEVTQAQWRSVMGNNPSHFSGCDRCPVESVSWDDVQNYIRKLNSRTGKTYRLPSEAEWEYACRSGGRDQTYCGGDVPDGLAWHIENSGRRSHPVGQKHSNRLGLYDMSGNVYEWVQDCENDSYNGAPSDGSAWQTGDCSYRFARGGSWHSIFEWTCSSYRKSLLRDRRRNYFGVRLARGS